MFEKLPFDKHQTTRLLARNDDPGSRAALRKLILRRDPDFPDEDRFLYPSGQSTSRFDEAVAVWEVS